MSVRNHNLETVCPVLATFKIKQSINGIDDLKDINICEPISLTGDSEVGLYKDEDTFIGKLIALTLSNNDDGERVATVQVGGVCRIGLSGKKAGDSFGRRGTVLDSRENDFIILF